MTKLLGMTVTKKGSLFLTGLLVFSAVIPLGLEAGDAKSRQVNDPESAHGSTGRVVDFNRDIAPILQAACGSCHGGKEAQAQLSLGSEAATLKGGVSGRAIIPGDSQHSLLVQRLLGTTDAPRMPPGAEPLSREKIELIRAWIDHGSFAALGTSAAQPALEPEPAHRQSTRASTVFATRIRPIFAARCYQCHGPDVQQNALRLDSLAAALAGSASGKVIILGSSERSRLVRRLLGLDRPQMPYGGPPLSAEEISLIRSWIDAGAPGPDSDQLIVATKPIKHWAYTKPRSPEVLQVKNTAWVRNPIDNFVLARLEKEGLSPAPEADKETLIRRASLDLIGLPPTPQEVDAFLAHKSPDAYEKLVDRLLASPHYGERWGRPWLDLARYADTNGYEKDNRRTAWKYRDWVINALNSDMSFKEFTIEQIAGDMLSDATTAQKIASGFNRNTLLNQEGGTDPEEQRFYTLVDRVNTTATVWLGTTLACAQCHNHKYDPFTQKDYYRLMAFFDNYEYKVTDFGQGEHWILEPELELPTPQQATQEKQIKGQISQLQAVLNTSTPELEAAQELWKAEIKNADANWTVLEPSRYSSKGGATLKLLPDQSILAGGKNPEADEYTLTATTDKTEITGVRIEVLGDPSLPHGGPGRDPDGNFFLTAVEVEAAPADRPNATQKVSFKSAYADESQEGYKVQNLIPTKNQEPGIRGWAIDSATKNALPRRQAILIPEKPLHFEHGARLNFVLKHELLHASRNIGRFRLLVTSIPEPAGIVQLPASLRPLLDIPSEKRTEEQKAKLAAAYRSVSPLLQATRDRIADLEKQREKLGIVTTLVMQERPTYQRPSTYLRVRGAFTSPGEKVYAALPAVLNPLPEDQLANRLGLAHWLVSEDNPLTARVAVNRYWQEIFGRGIVETAEDFGTQGERPTHPELLDWLATEFMLQGWSMKAIKRLMLTSATYRQSSRGTPELEERDPYNKLLARGPRFRVDAEMVRDIALAASGLLSAKIDGPSTFPYQPEGIWDRPYNDDKWVMSEGEDRYRRGIYVFIRRTSPYPSLITFDAPSREFCTVRRVRTNTPLQALTTLNDPAFFEAAKALARRMIKEGGGNLTDRVVYAFRLCVTRRPTPEELERLITFYKQQLERFRQDTKAASEVVKGYETASDLAEQAALTMVSSVLLNLEETITKE